MNCKRNPAGEFERQSVLHAQACAALNSNRQALDVLGIRIQPIECELQPLFAEREALRKRRTRLRYSERLHHRRAMAAAAARDAQTPPTATRSSSLARGRTSPTATVAGAFYNPTT